MKTIDEIGPMEPWNCKYCGQTIYFIKTKSGKSMPVNADRKVIVTRKGETVSGYESHFASCPEAKIKENI